MRENFIARVLKGEASADQIDDEVDAWHNSGEKGFGSLENWLGMDKGEYSRWVENDGALKDILRERGKRNDKRARTHMGTAINPDMGEGRYQDTLRRGRELIAKGLALDLDDCNITGMKSTEASWGLCSDSREMYPDVNDHTFPDDAVERGRLGAREPPKGATCPFDRGRFKPDALNPGAQGCFYRCMLFRPVKGQLPQGERVARVPTKAEALKLYDDLIAEREKLFGKKTTADDGEAKWEPSGAVKKRKS